MFGSGSIQLMHSMQVSHLLQRKLLLRLYSIYTFPPWQVAWTLMMRTIGPCFRGGLKTRRLTKHQAFYASLNTVLCYNLFEALRQQTR